MSSEKLEQAVEKAYKTARKIIVRNSPPDVHENAITVAAASMVPYFIEIDLDD